MMKTKHIVKTSLLVTCLLSASLAQAYNDYDARRDCSRKVAGWSSDYRDARFDNVEDTGWDSYNLNGKVRGRNDGKDHDFSCRIQHRELVSWNVNSKSIDDEHNDKKDKRNRNLAIGAGVIGLVALAAMVSNSKSEENPEQDVKRTDYSSGKGNPLADLAFLKNECNAVLRRHLDEDHGEVKSLDITNAKLTGRVLKGDGSVTFEEGSKRRLNFSCDFDRSGRIYDGKYSFR